MQDFNIAPRSDLKVGADLKVAFKGYADNSKCAVDQWAIKVGEEFFLANLIKPHTAPDYALWLFGSVATPNGKPVWGYKDDVRVMAGFTGHVFCGVHDGESCLVFATAGKQPKVVHVVPLLHILDQHEVEESLLVTITRKRAVATALNYEVQSTASESLLITYFAEQERIAEQKRREAEAAAKAEAKKAKVEAILARKHIRVYSSGRFFEAIYVYEGEWQMLPPRTQVILGEDGDDGLFHPKETFTVFKDTKRGAEPKKSFIFIVGIENEARSMTAELPKPVTTKVVFLDGQPFEVPTFGKTEDLQAHRAAGLNSGVLRGVMTTNGITLFRVRASGLEQVAGGSFQVIG